MRRWLPLVLVLGTGCSAPLGVEENELPLLRTERGEYVMEVRSSWVQVDVPYTFTNRSTATIYVGSCGGAIAPVFERLEEDRWVFAYQQPSEDCGATPRAVPPGDVLFEVAHMGLRLEQGHSNSYVAGAVEGQYRLRWPEASVQPFDGGGPPTGDLLPLQLSVSNTFLIREP